QLRSRRSYLVGQPQGTQTLFPRSARNTRICLADRHVKGDLRNRTRWAVNRIGWRFRIATSTRVAFCWRCDRDLGPARAPADDSASPPSPASVAEWRSTKPVDHWPDP